MTNIAIVTFEKFTDIDLWLMWDLLNRVRVPDWKVKIVGSAETHTSQTGIPVATQASIDFANSADAVLFVSGPGTRDCINNDKWLEKFDLDAERQLIGSICSGSLILAKLGLLDGKTATTYPTARQVLQSFGVEVVEKPIVEQGNIATAGGCLAQQYLVGWVIEKLADKDWRDLVLRSIQPVGEGLFFDDVERLQKLYAPVSNTAKV
jgi:transcriptional regulator GlxA family with amidase domain